ncbi:hypothetical protein [Streptomyces wedmorensis]
MVQAVLRTWRVCEQTVEAVTLVVSDPVTHHDALVPPPLAFRLRREPVGSHMRLLSPLSPSTTEVGRFLRPG